MGSSVITRSWAFLALLVCFLASTVSADPISINATVPDFGSAGGVKSITISSTIVAIVLMVAGFLFAFFGHKFFRITLFLAGFYLCATLAWIALTNFEPTDGYKNAQWVYLGVSGAAGLIGGALFLCFWRLGFAAIGGIAGFYLAVFILSWASSGVISNGTGRIIFIAAFVIVGIILTFFLERHIVIIGTAIVGSGSFFVGLDNFIHTGFQEAFTAFLGGNHSALFGGYQVTGKVYGMLAGTLGMMVIGICFQYYMHRGPFVPKSHRPQPYNAQPQYQQV
ncbi:hypothetical protein BGW38_001399 [Lunasporangiospora selenospora]|uniref:Transmembrane protein 198 n=1 Tax=Lunasporangiospora selenospora TaxID=979761 RepID=A0A9P6G262_9FUNG|nr:hypothetical protein BGW38_001399 [Lunasporangiospora selenospora]